MSVTYDVAARDFMRAGEAASKLKRLLQQLGLDLRLSAGQPSPPMKLK